MKRVSFVARVASATVLSCVALTALGAASPADTAAPIATQKYEVEGVQVDLLSVKRTSDGHLTVKWQYRNTTGKPVTIGANTGVMAGAWSEPYTLSWDARVIANGKEIKVPGQTMAAKHQSKTLVIPPKKAITNWAKFPDPGPEVQKITFSVQGADPFDDVSVT